MTHYRRFKIPGATYFFTLWLEDRQSRLLVDRIEDLRAAYAITAREMPVECRAMVVLPNHLHAIWTEPAGEVNYSERWRRIKARFSHLVGPAGQVNDSKLRRREVGVWQRRFWEHCIRDDLELAEMTAYCETNPVKHGLVARPEDWPYSSFFRKMGNIAHPTVVTSANKS